MHDPLKCSPMIQFSVATYRLKTSGLEEKTENIK